MTERCSCEESIALRKALRKARKALESLVHGQAGDMLCVCEDRGAGPSVCLARGADRAVRDINTALRGA